MSDPTERCCGTCDAWLRYGPMGENNPEIGACRANPPAFCAEEDADCFPCTTETTWCRAWAPKGPTDADLNLLRDLIAQQGQSPSPPPRGDGIPFTYDDAPDPPQAALDAWRWQALTRQNLPPDPFDDPLR